jgi:hypothetical protein
MLQTYYYASQVRGACMHDATMHAWLLLDQAERRLLELGFDKTRHPIVEVMEQLQFSQASAFKMKDELASG